MAFYKYRGTGLLFRPCIAPFCLRHAVADSCPLDLCLKIAVKNILRYIPQKYHSLLAPEFAAELEQFGHIYCYRFMPTQYHMKAYGIHDYPAKLEQARAMQLMIMNNLDPAVAQFPHELVTYGGNGSVFSNWLQYHLVMRFLSHISDTQTLVLNSGHPQGFVRQLHLSLLIRDTSANCCFH